MNRDRSAAARLRLNHPATAEVANLAENSSRVVDEVGSHPRRRLDADQVSLRVVIPAPGTSARVHLGADHRQWLRGPDGPHDLTRVPPRRQRKRVSLLIDQASLKARSDVQIERRERHQRDREEHERQAVA